MSKKKPMSEAEWLSEIRRVRDQWKNMSLLTVAYPVTEEDAEQVLVALCHEIHSIALARYLRLKQDYGYDPLTYHFDTPCPNPSLGIYDTLQEFKLQDALLRRLLQHINAIVRDKDSLIAATPMVMRELNQYVHRLWPILVFNIRPTWANSCEEFMVLLTGWIASGVSTAPFVGKDGKMRGNRLASVLGREAEQQEKPLGDLLLLELRQELSYVASVKIDGEGNFSSLLEVDTTSKVGGKVQNSLWKKFATPGELHQEKMRKRQLPHSEATLSDIEEVPDTANEYDRIDQQAEVDDVIKKAGLSRRQLKIFTDCEVNGLDRDDVAQREGVTRSTIDNTISQAWKKIRNPTALRSPHQN